MAETIPVERFRDELFRMFQKTFEHSVGIYLYESESLFETLDAVSPEDASRRVSPSVSTVAAHAEHAAFYLDVLREIMCGSPPGGRDWDTIWDNAHAVDAGEWDTIRQRLRESYQRVLDLFRAIEAWDGESAITSAMAALCHTAYHVGAIRQLLFLAQGTPPGP